MRTSPARAMPPAGRSRPAKRRTRHSQNIWRFLWTARPPSRPNPGRTDLACRLNRTEYRKAIRDLLALEVDVTSLLPTDDVSHGFDNVGVVTLPPSLMERYLSAAQKISQLAIGSPVRSPGFETVMMPPELTQDSHFEGLPFGTSVAERSLGITSRRMANRVSDPIDEGSQ